MKILNHIVNILLSLFGVLVLLVCVKIFAFDYFPVNTSSMAPTIQPGDRILVNKMIFGARIYKSLDFEEGKPLQSWRMPGWRKIRHNDIVVFNFVLGNENPFLMSFNFSKVYVKRCIGLPGDTLSIRNGFFHNTGTDQPLGIYEAQKNITKIDVGDFFGMHMYVMRHTEPRSWTMHNFGPIYIPKKGDVIELSMDNYRIYQDLIQFETQCTMTCEGDLLFLDGNPISHHKFEKSYYFMCGDNLSDSIDSRTWGLVPEDFIIGVAPRVFYARNSDNSMNWRRLFKRF